jgi:transcriptional regulator with XRE-family HTH domain
MRVTFGKSGQSSYDFGVYERLGLLIRKRREALGLEQAALAAGLDVRQQAVSGWENGRSRPRRSMLREVADLLHVEEAELVDAGDYPSAAGAVRLAVRPLTRALPLDELPEERFEDLLTEVMASLHPGGHTSRFGGRGSKQHGIDILVVDGDVTLATGQCKRHREFGPAAVTKAIDEVTIASPVNYLFLSRPTATPRARSAAAKHATWQLWDGEDISRHIRSLPREDAVRIVDTYFPGHRESFLGVAAPGPWRTVEEEFDVVGLSIFNHDWSLAGRQNQLSQLAEVVATEHAALTFLVGPGGVGKSRLIKEVAEKAPPTTRVRILSGTARPDAADFEMLSPDEDLTVIIDDAHDLAEAAGVVGSIWRRNRRATVILATRPYGLPQLKEQLARRNLLPIPHLEVELGDLDVDDSRQLAREALGNDVSEAAVRRLAALTADCPLATVVAGVLIRRGELGIDALEQDEQFRSQVMRGFRDALVSDPLVSDPSTRRAVLEVVAAVQPFRTSEEEARATLSAIVGQPYDRLHQHLRGLENAGVLRRRGDSLRIVPDLLGDVILTEAAFDLASSTDTGYLSRVEPLVTGASAERLFINVSRVDWQVRNAHPQAPSLSGSLWNAFRARVEAADVFERREHIDVLAKAAYFNPRVALELTRWLIEHPTEDVADDHTGWSGLLSSDYSTVLEALPPAIKSAALNADTLPEALTQLWMLTQNDRHDNPRHDNPRPGHPMRVLKELAEFSLTKPLWFNSLVTDVVETWLADGQRISPLEVLEPMLATEADTFSVRGNTIIFKPFSIKASAVMPHRQRVIDLAFAELRTGDLMRAGAAAKLLKSALQFPVGRFEREIAAYERDAWTPGMVDTIEELGRVASSESLDPAVLVSVRSALYRHDSFGSGATHDAAERAIESLPRDAQSMLAWMIHDGWGRLVRDRGDDIEAVDAKHRQLIEETIKLLEPHSDAHVVNLLDSRLAADRQLHGPGEGHPDPLLHSLLQARPSLERAVLEHLPATGATALDAVLPIILSAHAEHDPSAALDAITTLLDSPVPGRRHAAVHALGWNRGRRSLHAGELDLMMKLAADQDVVVRRSIMRAGQLLARDDATQAARLLAAVPFGDDAQLADAFFMTFRLDSGISWDTFSTAELDRIRADLVTVTKIEDYSISTALADRSAHEPHWVLDLLLDRIEHAASFDSTLRYDAVPHNWDTKLRIRETTAFVACLERILVWVADDLESWGRKTMGADLFAAVAHTYDEIVRELLADALATGDETMALAVVAVLHEAPRTFIWDAPDFVLSAMRTTAHLGADIQRRLTGALWSATVTGMRSGVLGEPFPETIEQRDRSREIANNLPAGSLERKFYTDMALSAERDITREFDEDLASDGRDW